MADRTETQTDSDAIRRDIERTRAEMDGTVDELSDRLSPGRVLDEVWHRVRSGDGGAGVGDILRDHPVPLALMGLGLGWLAVEQATGRSGAPDGRGHDGPGTWAPAEGRRGPYRGDAVDHDDPDWEHAGTGAKLKAKASGAAEAVGDATSRAAGAAHSMKEKVSGAADSAKEAASDAADSARDRAEHLRDEASQRASRARSRAAGATREAKRQAQQGFWGLLDDSPLALGAIALGLGLASGLSAPSTRTEDELMGRTSDTLKDEARRVGKDTATKAKQVAQDAAGAAADEAARQQEKRDVSASAGESVRQAKEAAKEAAGEMKEAAREVGQAAREAARESAEDRGLTKDALEDEAQKAGERTRSQARRDAKDAKRKAST